jgi:hypothetical protein
LTDFLLENCLNDFLKDGEEPGELKSLDSSLLDEDSEEEASDEESSLTETKEIEADRLDFVLFVKEFDKLVVSGDLDLKFFLERYLASFDCFWPSPLECCVCLDF